MQLWYGETDNDFVSEHGWVIYGPGPGHGGATRFSTKGATAHANSFDLGTESVANIGRIVSGLMQGGLF